MDWIINIFYYIVPFLVLLGILVFVHELGHFLIARAVGVQVEDFSIGFGKEIWGFYDKHGTRWKISLVPLGGYVRMLGDADATSVTADEETKQMSEEEKKKSFTFASPYKKLAIALAGPVSNYVFAILVFSGIFYFMGKVSFPPVVGEIIAGGAAEEAGLQVGDRILDINGKEVKSFSDVQREVEFTSKDEMLLTIRRNDQEVKVSVPLKEIEVEGEDGKTVKKAMLGVRSVNMVELEAEDLSLVEAVEEAVEETWNITTATLQGVGQMISGKRNADEVGGVIRIAEMSGDISKQHSVVAFLVFTALLSINLGLINLFPIPILDGGQVVIYLVEIVKGKEINEKFKEWMFKFGFGLIILLLIFATWNDVSHLFNRWFS